MLTLLYTIFIILCTVPFLSAQNATQKLSALPHDGHIRFYVYHLDEVDDIRYLDDQGNWIPSAYNKINKMMRSRDDSEEIKMDKRLIILADHLQDQFKVDTIEIISGFRSTAFNKVLKNAGRNVANESFHTKGMAMDVHIDELKESTVRDYLLKLKLGGVGYYGNVLMVHMDFGPVRFWHAGNYRENTEIGIFNDKNSLVIKTDKLFYNKDSVVQLSYTGINEIPSLDLHKFHRGKWHNIGTFPVKRKKGKGGWQNSLILKELLTKIQNMPPYGKFRFQYKKGDQWQNSNEFYVKKL